MAEIKKTTAKAPAPKKAAGTKAAAKPASKTAAKAAQAAEAEVNAENITVENEAVEEKAPVKAAPEKTESANIHKEEKRMSQEALGMIETRGLVAAVEAADGKQRSIQAGRAGSYSCNSETAYRRRADPSAHQIIVENTAGLPGRVRSGSLCGKKVYAWKRRISN